VTKVKCPVLFAAKATRTHVYFAMKNNDGTAGNFREYILNVINHYQVSIPTYII